MRAERVEGRTANAVRGALLLFLVASPLAEAGLRLRPDASPLVGADVRALAQASGVVWAGTASGVFRGPDLSAAWPLDGLSGQPATPPRDAQGKIWLQKANPHLARTGHGTNTSTVCRSRAGPG